MQLSALPTSPRGGHRVLTRALRGRAFTTFRLANLLQGTPFSCCALIRTMTTNHGEPGCSCNLSVYGKGPASSLTRRGAQWLRRREQITWEMPRVQGMLEHACPGSGHSRTLRPPPHSAARRSAETRLWRSLPHPDTLSRCFHGTRPLRQNVSLVSLGETPP